ncbi:MAG: sigma-E processing peptidase SpoIIGA [Clostridia bacterium]|nr:sigma-E processing peptidase SpoIIGA [Clostridia bacterium]
MKTLYIDVYFLINFTVDLLALYFASCFSKVPTSTKRLLISSAVGALIAVGVVLLPEYAILKFIIATAGLIAMGFIAPKRVSARRKLKFVFAFLIFEALLGGAVSFLWGILDKYISNFFDGAEGGAVNRKMLFLSLIVLLSIGVFKMLVSFFSNIESEGSVDVEISFLDNTAVVSAFVDSGNLAVDPMDLSPILLLKKEVAKTILPENIIELSNIDSLERKVKKRIRLVPLSRGGETHVMVGVKADAVRLVGGKNEELRVTLVIDKEGGDFGGYKALMPAAALDNAIR